ncbi:MAG: hypothetical protein ABFD97_11610 [Syntrophobacter sp.]
MDTDALSLEEFACIKCMLDISERLGLDWPVAVSLFPANTEEERRWKHRMLLGIQLVHTEKARETPSESIP